MHSLQCIIRSFAFHTQIWDNDSERKWRESKQNNFCPETHLLKTPSAFHQNLIWRVRTLHVPANDQWAGDVEASQSVTKGFVAKIVAQVGRSKTCGNLDAWFVFVTPS